MDPSIASANMPSQKISILHVVVSKNRGTPKWMVKIMGNPIKIDDLVVLETPMWPWGFSNFGTARCFSPSVFLVPSPPSPSRFGAVRACKEVFGGLIVRNPWTQPGFTKNFRYLKWRY